MTESSSAASNELIRLKSEHAALQQQVSALRECLEAYPQWPDECPHGEEVDLCLQCETDYLRNVQRWKVVRDAALTQPPESGKGALGKMSPQLRNVLYDLIRKVPPLADNGDQQAMNELIAEVMPSPEPAPEVKL